MRRLRLLVVAAIAMVAAPATLTRLSLVKAVRRARSAAPRLDTSLLRQLGVSGALLYEDPHGGFAVLFHREHPRGLEVIKIASEEAVPTKFWTQCRYEVFAYSSQLPDDQQIWVSFVDREDALRFYAFSLDDHDDASVLL